MKNNEQKIVKTYNGCEVTITFAGRDDKAMEEAKRFILESLYEKIFSSERMQQKAIDIGAAVVLQLL